MAQSGRRARKRHVQQDLFIRARKRTRGVKLGRRPKGPRSSERHGVREKFKASEPVHVNIRVGGHIGSLRKHDMFLAIREATIAVAKYEDFRIVHMSVQGTHIHLIVEAESRLALARGMQAFQISAAKQIKRVLVERGREKPPGAVFTDRYHARILRSPREVRNCIAYVMNNWRHHGEDKKRFARTWNVDPYSSGLSFNGWKELEDRDVMWHGPSTYESLIVWRPKSYLLSTLWRKHGLIRCHEIPGGHAGDE